ncbi:MFS transporter [Arthrobacter sp. Edens01]|nr:MFS transporter [Arthrobacter sp. Edens01]
MQKTASGPPVAEAVEFSGHRRGSPGYRGVLVGLAAAGMATFAQLYSVQGLLPQLAGDFGVSAATAALSVSAATLGLAVAVIPWSAAADRFGRLPVMRTAIIAAVILGLLVPLATDFSVLLALRFAEGAALGGIPAVALAYLSEEVSPAHAAVAAGTYVSGTTVGGLAGRILAAPLGEYSNWRIGVAAVSLLAAVAAVVFMLSAPKQRGYVPQRRADGGASLAARLAGNLRSGRQLVLYAQAFLLMGGFVAVYNYLGFRLELAPFNLPQSLASSLFLAYLAGTWSSRIAGRAAGRVPGGRRTVLLAGTGVMAAGLALTLLQSLPAVIIGLVVFTGGFFGAHAVASGWVPVMAAGGRAQASSLYNLAYYAGSSLLGWLAGFFFQGAGWPGLAGFVLVLLAAAAGLAATLPGLRQQGNTGTGRRLEP